MRSCRRISKSTQRTWSATFLTCAITSLTMKASLKRRIPRQSSWVTRSPRAGASVIPRYSTAACSIAASAGKPVPRCWRASTRMSSHCILRPCTSWPARTMWPAIRAPAVPRISRTTFAPWSILQGRTTFKSYWPVSRRLNVFRGGLIFSLPSRSDNSTRGCGNLRTNIS